MSWLGDYDDPYDEYDESSVRERPNPKANRPRSKQRPEHEDAVTGIVTGVALAQHGLVVASGTLNAVTTVQVGSQISGQVKEIFADFNTAIGLDGNVAESWANQAAVYERQGDRARAAKSRESSISRGLGSSP